MKSFHRSSSSKVKYFFYSLFSIFIVAESNHCFAQGQVESIAILGDSLGTGAATHPAMVFDNIALWKIFNGKKSIAPTAHGSELEKYQIFDNPKTPTLLPRGAREFRGSANWVVFNMIQLFSEKYLNTEQYSWGYMVGRSLGVQPDKILIAAENGARVSSIARQADRVLNHLNGHLPQKIMILYTGNDLCAVRPELITSQNDYRDALHGGLKYLVKNGIPHPSGTEISVVGFVGILQLIGQDKILNKKVMAFGEEVTCRKLRETSYLPSATRDIAPGVPLEAIYLSNLIPPNPARMCPTLFGKPNEVKEHLSGYANRIRHFRKIAADVVDMMTLQMDKDQISGIKFRYVSQTEKVTFVPEDIAGDCFHLTVKGQGKLADAILSNY